MPEQLPAGWVKATLGQITAPSRARALPVDVQESRYIGLEHIEPHTMRLLGYGIARDIRSSSLRFSCGDVLYGRLRPYLNKVWVAEFDGLCSGEFLILPVHDGLNNAFLAARLNAADFVAFAAERVSGERPRVSFQTLSPFPILLPPSPEQDRIISTLNATTSRIRAGEVAAHRAKQRVQRYRSAVLQAAVTGALTRAWRRRNGQNSLETGAVLLRTLLATRRMRWEQSELQRLRAKGREPKADTRTSRYHEPTLPATNSPANHPPSWSWATLEQLSWTRGYGTSAKCTYAPDGLPVLRIPNIRNRGLDLHDLKYATDFQVASDSDFIAPGDMLLIRTNGSKDLLGRAAVVTTPLEPRCTFASYLIRHRLLGDNTLWSWISLAWDSNMLRNRIESTAKTTAGQYNLSLSGLADISIPLPPLSEQSELVRAVARRMTAADRLVARVHEQLLRAHSVRDALTRRAFRGRLVPQDPADPPASVLLQRLQSEPAPRRTIRRARTHMAAIMREPPATPESLRAAWHRIRHDTDARRLFDAARMAPEQVLVFYQALRDTPELRAAFQRAARQRRPSTHLARPRTAPVRDSRDRFRLIQLWLEDFKNLQNYTLLFNPNHGLDVMLGRNGTGKSNIFEALVILFRDLYDWRDNNRWPDKPLKGFRVLYELNGHRVEVSWSPPQMKRPTIRSNPALSPPNPGGSPQRVRRDQLPLPSFVFGYYSGPTNRLAEHFLPMKQAHYDRLREAEADDTATLVNLLEERRFFCAETHHAKYVLLAFLYKEDAAISNFLETRLRIVGFESALFVVRKPRWAKKGSTADDFWGATGIMRRVMERLRNYAIAPMVVEQKVSYGYRSTNEEHYYFLLPDINSLHSFAGEYDDARTFFLALESTDFSELLHDVKIQMRVRASATDDVSITFHQLSEGEQQLLMVLGLMRFTQSHQSLVLLDEPDTHLNPDWSIHYLKDLTKVMSENVQASLSSGAVRF